MCSLETATRQLNFDEPRIPRKETEYPRVHIWKHKKGRRLDFGVADPSVLLNCPGKQKNVMFPWNVSFGLEISIQPKVSQNAVSALLRGRILFEFLKFILEFFSQVGKGIWICVSRSICFCAIHIFTNLTVHSLQIFYQTELTG